MTNVNRIVYFVVLGGGYLCYRSVVQTNPQGTLEQTFCFTITQFLYFNFQFPRKSMKTICNICLPNKPSTWGSRNSTANIVLHTLAQITKYFQFPSKSIHLIEKSSAEIYLYFHLQGQSLGHSACPTAAMIRIFL